MEYNHTHHTHRANRFQKLKTSSPTELAITLAAAKRQLRIEADETHYDLDIIELIRAATDYVERRTNLTMINTTFTAKWLRFPSCQLCLPGYPIASIQSVQYYSVAGVLTTLAAYQESLASKPAYIQYDIATDWPDTQDERIDAVQVAYTAGYGTDYTTVPFQCAQIIKLIVAHWFRNREAVLSNATSKEIEIGVKALIYSVQANEFQEFAQQ